MEIDWRTSVRPEDHIVLIAFEEAGGPETMCYARVLAVNEAEVSLRVHTIDNVLGRTEKVPIRAMFGKIDPEFFDEARTLGFPDVDWFVTKIFGDPKWLMYHEGDSVHFKYRGQEFLA